MTVTAVRKDPETLSLTITAEFAAPVERLWQIWEDPRQLERWWGPPGYPATFTTHELRPGGAVAYYMTAPEGSRYHGWWEVREVDPPRSISFLDGFGNDDGTRNETMPVSTVEVRLEDAGEGRSRMTVRSVFETAEALEKVLSMGAEEGFRQALGQIDDILAVDERVA